MNMNKADAKAQAQPVLVPVDVPGVPAVPGAVLAENLRGERLKAMDELPEEEKAARRPDQHGNGALGKRERERDTSQDLGSQLNYKRQAQEIEQNDNDKSSQLFRAGSPALPGDRVLKAMVEVPKEDKAAYLQAVDKCPQLIRSETDPHRYLKHANWEPLVAAKCLALNWKVRLGLFGGERAFLSLKDLSGNLALNQADIEVLNSGFLTPLPKDTQGRTVLFVNPLLAGPLDEEEASRARCFFYLLQIAAEKERPFVLIRFGNLNQARRLNASTIIECFPIELVGFYGLFMSPPGAGRVFKETMIPLFLQHLSEKFRSVAQTVVSESPQDMLQELIQLGFEAQSLPKCAGGTWSCDKLTKWPDFRLPSAGVKGQRVKADLDEPHLDNKTDHPNDQVNEMELENTLLFDASMALANPQFDYKVVLLLNNLAISMMKAGCYEQAYATLNNAADVSKILKLDLEEASEHIQAKLNQSIQRLSTPNRSPKTTLPLSVIAHNQATALSNMPNVMIQIDDTQHDDLVDNAYLMHEDEGDEHKEPSDVPQLQIDDTQHDDLVDTDDIMEEDDGDEHEEPSDVPKLLMSIVFYNHAIASRFLDQAAQENYHADRYLALSLRLACECYEDCSGVKVIQRATAIASLVLLRLQKGDYDDSVLREIQKAGYQLVSCLESTHTMESENTSLLDAAKALANPQFDYKVVLFLNNLAISMMKAGCYEQAYATLKNAADVSKILVLDLEGASEHITAKLNQSIQRPSTPVRSPKNLPLSVITHDQATALSNMPNVMIQIDDTQHDDLVDNDDLMDEDDGDEHDEPSNVPQLLMSIVFYNHAIASRFLDKEQAVNCHADKYLALSLRLTCECYEDCSSEKVIQRATAIAALVLITLQKGDYGDSAFREIRKSDYQLVTWLESA
jgi:hypothetical protein